MSTLISTPFGASSTADEVIAGVDLTGKRAIVTGGASGIGLETARALAAAGAEVTLAVRDVTAGEVAAREIADEGARVLVAELDLSSPASVRRFVEAWSGPLDILVDNAGVMATPETHTAEGRELQFATNHLGHFQLTVGLHDALAEAARGSAGGSVRAWAGGPAGGSARGLAGAAGPGGARVVVVSSVGHINGEVLFDDVDFARTPYDPWVAYSQSKTANILFAVEAARGWAADGITVNALNPGRIAATKLSRHLALPPASFDPAGTTGVSVKTVEQGAATSVLLAASPLVEGVTGRYFEDANEAGPVVEGVRRGVASYALDPDKARRLWSLSESLLAKTAE
ncbi:MAG: short-chain dehydrogenase/reductase [Subtercola sp.]|nr:short-chain dehydrogenase/reductase [Subtercola sp.]